MERVISQEPKSDSGHSCAIPANECDSSSFNKSSRVTSVAALGLALSAGAFGAFLPYQEAAIAADLLSAGRTPDLLSDSLQAASASPASAPPLEITAPSHHLVENGESLWQIAQQYRTDIQALKAANGHSLESGLRVGLVLEVPSGSERSIVQPSAPAASPTAPAEMPEEMTETSEISRTSRAVRVEPPTLQPAPQAATLQSEEKFSPLMVPVTEAEPADPLRSAGLVSQSEGFKKELENRRSAESATQEAEAPASVPSMPSDALSSTPAPADFSVRYQVRSGDTVGNIARSFGLSPEQLIQANAISNPNLIIAGDQLVVPRTQAQLGVGGPAPTPTTAQSAEPAANETVLKREATERSERLARLQESAARPLETAQTDSTDGPAIAIARADVAGETEPTAAADPYVASLLQEVEAIQPDETPVVDAGSKMPEAAAESTNGEEDVVNPEFRPESRPESRSESQAQAPEPQQLAVTDSSASAVDTSELLAAAPLSPDAYTPSSRPTAGQTVSPDMPLLPDADQYLPEAPDYFNGYIWPTRGTVTSGYGWRWGRMHRGVDVAGPVGTPIVAAAAGVIERSGWNSGGYGNLVDIRHSDGSMTRYAHNNRLLVRQGQPVRQGQQVAEMGSTGYSTGPHLHFEVHVPNQGAVNPVAYLPAR